LRVSAKKFRQYCETNEKHAKSGRGEVHSASSGDVSHNQFSFFSRTIKLIQDSDLESDESVNKVNEFEFL
jgi:hypothetical protein